MSRIAELIEEMCPNGVEYLELGKLIMKNIGGGTPSKSKSEYWDGDIPWVSVGDLNTSTNYVKNTRSKITLAGVEGSSTNVIPAGSVIVAIKISPGKLKIAGTDLAINQDIRGLILKDCINPDFLAYYFQIVNVQGHGTIVKSITSKTLEKIKVPVPPLKIQEEIVKILDRFTLLEAELEARRKQYTFYLDSLLNFENRGGGKPHLAQEKFRKYSKYLVVESSLKIISGIILVFIQFILLKRKKRGFLEQSLVMISMGSF
ncbi:restriction endonuclease subunit S [Rothia nasimurium]|uniref:restriction endonuclease subunit S n=1 Tax=Rothia nasimurium TaxID=85336 RepID=UPI001EFFB2ED|nr:restriction endonuclease subunit S [Rothia nasimurium]